MVYIKNGMFLSPEREPKKMCYFVRYLVIINLFKRNSNKKCIFLSKIAKFHTFEDDICGIASSIAPQNQTILREDEVSNTS